MKPPRGFEAGLRALVPRGPFGQALLGDLREEYAALAISRTPRFARWWYRGQAFRLAARYGLRRVVPRLNRDTPGRPLSSWQRREYMGQFVQDVRYAVRTLARQPGFAIAVLVTLALGIGANTAIFSVVNGVLLRPLPYPESDRLVRIYGRFLPESGFDFPEFPLSNPEFVDYRDDNRSMEAVTAIQTFGANVTTGDGDPERIGGAAATPELFTILQVPPLAGRGLTADDAVAGAEFVVVLSYDLWQRRFGGDADILGRTIDINGSDATVVGVMPPQFGFPTPRTQLWTAFQIDPVDPNQRSSHNTIAFGRLAMGVTLEQANAEMTTMMARWKDEWPTIHTGHFLFLRPLLEDVVGNARTALLMLLGAVGFVLLIVCANVANLLLARGEHRRREMALRGALGAGRQRIFQQLLTESVVLAAVGGTLGLAIAVLGTRALLSVDAGSIPRIGEISTDWRVLAFSAGVTLATGILFGLLPAAQAASPDLQEAFRETGRSATAGRARLQFRKGLVATEMALSVLLVIGAGLTMRSFWRLLDEDPGFDPDRVLVAQLSLSSNAYSPEQASGFYTNLLRDVRALPGVTEASAITNLPIMHGRGVNDFLIEGRAVPAPGEMAWNAAYASPRAGYFETMRVPVLQGRVFDKTDRVGSLPVAVINQALAETFFAGEDPIGKRIRFSGGATPANVWRTIVGVVGNVKYEGLDIEARPTYYFSNEQAVEHVPWNTRFLTLTVRTAGDPLQVGQAVRAVIRRHDPALPVVGLQPMTDVVSSSVARPRFTVTLLGVFAVVALVLGAVGIYGVMSFSVAQRVGEIGIRIALGAGGGRVAGMVVRQGMGVAVAGVAVGLVGALAGARVLRSQLFEVSATDPVTFVAVAGLLTTVAFVASYLPARRAARVDPMKAIRGE